MLNILSKFKLFIEVVNFVLLILLLVLKLRLKLLLILMCFNIVREFLILYLSCLIVFFIFLLNCFLYFLNCYFMSLCNVLIF